MGDSQVVTNEDIYTIPGGEICQVCGLRYYARSMGGPNMCSACDCGFSGHALIEAQRAEIERLRTHLKELIEYIELDSEYPYSMIQNARSALEPEAPQKL
jgi:hypothetical protein